MFPAIVITASIVYVVGASTLLYAIMCVKTVQ
jgi:hypothetical protein